MIQHLKKFAPTALVLAATVLATSTLLAAGDSAIGDFMKKYHKAPKGTDPVCKKAQDGKATPEEIRRLVTGYKLLTTAKPPKGDEARRSRNTAVVRWLWHLGWGRPSRWLAWCLPPLACTSDSTRVGCAMRLPSSFCCSACCC